jgi:hypothetical protein
MAKPDKSDMTEALPVMAMAMMEKGTGESGSKAQALLGEFLQDVMEERRAKKARAERLRLNSVKIAKEDAERRSQEKANCSHRNQRGETRLRGQYLSGTKQLCLVCMFCSDEFHRPPMGNGQKAPPPELVPSADVIGG